MKDSLKTVGYYFLTLQLHVIAVLLIQILLQLVLSFFLRDEVLFLTVEMAVGLVAELFLCAWFIKRQVGKRTTSREILLPFLVALVLHFLVALINTFYVYTAGVAANAAARIWETVVRGESVVMKDVAFWRRVLTFLPVQLLLALSAYLGYQRGKRANNG